MCFSLFMVVLRSLNTILERRISDARHGIRDGHARQAGAVTECRATNARHGVRDGHARQAGAVIERRAADTRYGVRDGHARQAGAATERRAADARHGVPDGHARQARAATERIVVDARHGVSCTVVRDGLRDDHVAGVFIGVVSIRATLKADGQLRVVVRPDVIDGFAIVRRLNVVRSGGDACHAEEQGEEESVEFQLFHIVCRFVSLDLDGWSIRSRLVFGAKLVKSERNAK